jgi:hypothetical protein
VTLIVSLRIPDGIVIAGDSLSTMVGQGQLEATIDVTCQKCEHKQAIQQSFQIPPVSTTTFSYAQKVFPFYNKFGIGTWGIGLLASKSIYFAMRLIERKFIEDKISFKGVSDVAQKIGDEIHELLKQQLKSDKTSIDVLGENQFPLGFQVVGYDKTKPATVEVYVGKEVRIRTRREFGCTFSGVGEVVQAIWGLYKENPKSQVPYPLFTLQDAIDYAEFLIRTTILHQRFSQTIPNVGGEIDVALVTPFNEFQWIRQKSIGKILGGQQNETNSGC